MHKLGVLECLLVAFRFDELAVAEGVVDFGLPPLAADEVYRLVMRDLVEPDSKRLRRTKALQPTKDGEPHILQHIKCPVGVVIETANEIQQTPFVGVYQR